MLLSCSLLNVEKKFCNETSRLNQSTDQHQLMNLIEAVAMALNSSFHCYTACTAELLDVSGHLLHACADPSVFASSWAWHEETVLVKLSPLAKHVYFQAISTDAAALPLQVQPAVAQAALLSLDLLEHTVAADPVLTALDALLAQPALVSAPPEQPVPAQATLLSRVLLA
jgi:hypothetical protein